MKLRKHIRRYIAHPALQRPFWLLYRFALMGMNYGGAGSGSSAGDKQALVRLARLSQAPVVLDVGANVGTYLRQVFDFVDGARVHAFEPSQAAYARLASAFGADPRVVLNRQGIGATNGHATLWSTIPGSVLGSMYAATPDMQGESIDIVSLDAYCIDREIDHIHLLKLDLEGGELDALRGAGRLIERDAIDVIQFEFGQPSLGARTYFADLFSLLAPRYEIYRVLPAGLERIPAYHETLEVFMSTNYLAVSRHVRARFLES